MSYSREKWIVWSTTKEFVKQSNFLCVSLLQTPKSRRSRHGGLKEEKTIVLIETDNSFCHREIFNSVMGFKENKQGFNILTLQLLPLLALCKPYSDMEKWIQVKISTIRLGFAQQLRTQTSFWQQSAKGIH